MMVWETYGKETRYKTTYNHSEHNPVGSTTIGYIKATMGNMDHRITTLTTKVEQHNNFGLRLVELETKVRMLEQHLDRRHK